MSESVGRKAVRAGARHAAAAILLAPEIVRKYVRYGASVRATQFLTLAAKARALMQGRYHVTHEDIARSRCRCCGIAC